MAERSSQRALPQGAPGGTEGGRRGGIRLPEVLPTWLRVEWPTVVFLLLAAGVLGWVGRSLFVAPLAQASTRSDFWEHAAALRALMDAPFSPQNPHLDTADPSPRFIPEFVLLALLARVLGWSAIQALALGGVLHLAVLIAGVYAFYRLYFRDPRAPLYGLIVALGSWYDGFHYSNVYQLSILFEVAGYPSTAAIAFSFVAFAIAVRVLRGPPSRGWLALLGLCVTNVALTHPLTATMTVTGVGALSLLEPGVERRRRWLVLGVVGVACLVIELWPLFSTWQTLRGGDDVDLSWVTGGGDEVPEDAEGKKPHLFYRLVPLARTIGFAAIGAYALLLAGFTGRHRFMLLSAVVMLLPFVVNATVEVPLGHRFILLAIPFMQMGLVWMLLKATPGYHEGWWRLRGPPWVRHLSALGVAAALGTMVVVNVDRADDITHSWRGTRRSVIQRCRAVGDAAGPGAVVMSDPLASWSLPACGVKVVALQHPNPLVPDQRVRSALVERFLDPVTSNAEREQILERYRATHVLTHGKTPPEVIEFLRWRARSRELARGFTLHTLRR